MSLAGCSPQVPPPSQGRTPVWIDTDPAIGEPDRDVDDGFALIQAFRSEALVVRGVSAVFGSAPLVRTWPIAQDVVMRFGPEGMRPWRGASGPHELQAPTEASEALATALRAERLTVIALGPLTNIASTLRRAPGLRGQVERIVAVAGRRPGEPPATDEATALRRYDVNVEFDVEAMRIVLDSGVPLTLAAVELSSQVWIDADDLARLAGGPVAARFLAESSKGWLRLWQETYGAKGFPPSATFAVDLVSTPGRVGCLAGRAVLERGPADAPAWRPPDAPGVHAQQRDQLIVHDGGPGRPVTYCHAPDEGFKQRLLETLLR
jgi:inosine-uridine nucleoside N-ribohydrolase